MQHNIIQAKTETHIISGQSYLIKRTRKAFKMSKNKLPLFIEGKVRLWYRLTNKNKTGFMSKMDFNEMADSFISEFGLAEKTGKEIRSWLVDGWDALIAFSKTTVEGEEPLISQQTTPLTLMIAEKITKGDKINEDLYIDAYSEVLGINKGLFPAVFSQMVSAFFNIFDTNKDGFITVDDMTRGLKCFGIDQSDPLKLVFAELDSTGSGKIDRDTYVSAWLEFMTGMNKAAPIAKHLNPRILYPPENDEGEPGKTALQ